MNMAHVNELLTEEVAKMKKEITDLDLNLKRLKFDAKAGSDQRDIKIDNLEKTFIEHQNSVEDMAGSVTEFLINITIISFFFNKFFIKLFYFNKIHLFSNKIHVFFQINSVFSNKIHFFKNNTFFSNK